MIGFLGVAGLAAGADLSQAVVRQKVNVVTLAPNLTAEARPAGEGTVIRDENVVRTGTESRAELEFTDLTLARLGSNSIFSFDAKARAMNFTQGAVLFSKPTKSGAVQLRSGAISGAITGSTGFISNVRSAQARGKGQKTNTLVGMLEGKFNGGARWMDGAGKEHTSNFQLGPGQLMVARPDGPPRVAQFDIPRFMRTSPLVKGFKNPLQNMNEINQAVADYQADERAGFVDKSNIMVSTKPRNIALVGQVLPLDVVAQRQNQNPGFLDIGSSGIIRGQLIWNTSADLDLYLTLPGGQVVSFGNVSVSFNGGRANARLDHDNLGNTIDVPPTTRVENIVVNGVPLSGLYNFVVNNFSGSGAGTSFTLRVFYNGQLQILNGTVGPGQNSSPIFVRVPRR
jgi:hypothetical protein